MNNSAIFDNRCAFASMGVSGAFNGCKALYVDFCDGLDPDCKFRKTKTQLAAEKDRSIDRHRARRLCGNCKYHSSPCRKSDEVDYD